MRIIEIIIDAYLVKGLEDIEKIKVIVDEVNYKLIKAKLKYEYNKIIDILKDLKNKGLINSLTIPIDKTLIRTRNSYRVGGIKQLTFKGKADTLFQRKINNLTNIKKEIKKSIKKIQFLK